MLMSVRTFALTPTRPWRTLPEIIMLFATFPAYRFVSTWWAWRSRTEIIVLIMVLLFNHIKLWNLQHLFWRWWYQFSRLLKPIVILYGWKIRPYARISADCIISTQLEHSPLLLTDFLFDLFFLGRNHSEMHLTFGHLACIDFVVRVLRSCIVTWCSLRVFRSIYDCTAVTVRTLIYECRQMRLVTRCICTINITWNFKFLRNVGSRVNPSRRIIDNGSIIVTIIQLTLSWRLIILSEIVVSFLNFIRFIKITVPDNRISVHFFYGRIIGIMAILLHLRSSLYFEYLSIF